jgi:hypothetical protein
LLVDSIKFILSPKVAHPTNMEASSSVWIFGGNVEDRLGHATFTVFYLLCGLGATFAQLAVTGWDRMFQIWEHRGPLPGCWARAF